MSTGIEYEYIGPCEFYIDRQLGTNKVWNGKGKLAFSDKPTLDELREIGNIVAIDPAFAARFEEVLVKVPMPQFRRVTSRGQAAKAIPEGDLIPVGEYSGYSPDQIRSLYIGKTGKVPTPEQTLVELVHEMVQVDAYAIVAGAELDDL
jgi:hypothetical protein